MRHILPDIKTLMQYIEDFGVAPKVPCPDNCLKCGHNDFWRYGSYPRKPERKRSGKKSLNPVMIPRFMCIECRSTCSVLPECIPPRRWYLWAAQQAVLLLLLSGATIRQISQMLTPSRRSISRWHQRFKEQFLAHASILRSQLSELGRTNGWHEFWESCLKQMSLAKAMRICNDEGVIIP